MKAYEVSLEILDPTAMWTRPDTGGESFGYHAPTYSVAKGMIGLVCCLDLLVFTEDQRT